MTDESLKVLVLGETEDRHDVGDVECREGWCGYYGYPKPCQQPDCNGLVHASTLEESWEGPQMDTKCDACGEPG